MSERPLGSPVTHRWYARPVLFVADVNRALSFYLETLGFTKAWHEGDGEGTVCQVNRGECEIILCETAERNDRGRLFVEVTEQGLAELRGEIAERRIATRQAWWGYPIMGRGGQHTARVAGRVPR